MTRLSTNRTDRPLAGLRSFIEPLEARQLLTVFHPLSSAQFTTALTDAQLGDTIILQAGTTYTGQFTLPNKTSGSGWITIESSNLDALPGEGVRVGPGDAVNMPTLQAPGSNASVVRTPPGKTSVTPVIPASPSHHYRFIGIEFVGPANNSDVTALIELGTSTSAQTTMDSVAHDFVIDRCYMHPNSQTAGIRRAVALNSASTDIINSYIENIHQAGSDSQAIGGWNGPGPYNIINNQLEGASENVMFGGDTTRLVGAVPSDIVIRGNYITKPLWWRGAGYNTKNLFELKAGRRVLVEGNIMENCWEDGQTGVPIVLKLGNWGTSDWLVTEDITIRNNIIRHANGSIALQGRDYAENSPDGLVRRLTIANNLFDDINGYWSKAGTGKGTFNIYVTQGPKDVTIDHNTFLNGNTTIEVDSSNQTYPATNFRFTNNIANHSNYGVRSTSGTGDPTFSLYFNEGTTAEAQARFTHNVLMSGPRGYHYDLRPNTWFPATWADVGFVDQAGGDYRLADTSPFKLAATDGTDLGADIGEINLRTAGAISGSWPQALQNIVINDGQAQRSKVTQIVLEFNQPVTLAAGALALTRRGGSGVSLIATPSADLRTYTLTFTGSGIVSGSLEDGIYDFLADVSNFRDSFNMVPIGTHTDRDESRTFHRLFGDSDGDRDVDSIDSLRFRQSLGSTTTGAAYKWYFDFDGDGDVDSVDSLRFRQRQGILYTY